jgi:hypothetical protein
MPVTACRANNADIPIPAISRPHFSFFQRIYPTHTPKAVPNIKAVATVCQVSIIDFLLSGYEYNKKGIKKPIFWGWAFKCWIELNFSACIESGKQALQLTPLPSYRYHLIGHP